MVGSRVVSMDEYRYLVENLVELLKSRQCIFALVVRAGRMTIVNTRQRIDSYGNPDEVLYDFAQNADPGLRLRIWAAGWVRVL